MCNIVIYAPPVYVLILKENDILSCIPFQFYLIQWEKNYLSPVYEMSLHIKVQ